MIAGISFFRKAFSIAPNKYFKDSKILNFEMNFSLENQSLDIIKPLLQKYRLNLTYFQPKLIKGQSFHKKILQVSVKRSKNFKLDLFLNQLYCYGISTTLTDSIKVPWFPKSQKQLYETGNHLLQVTEQQNNDSLQFTDLQYRKRRNEIANASRQYQKSSSIPVIDYTNDEHQLWAFVYKRLRQLHKDSMCSRFEFHMENLNRSFNLEKKIPQLKDLSAYLKQKTQFTLKPVHGIISQREFLNALAFRKFFCTQYIRHKATPFYTPQPDVIHEIVGHISMFADPDVANISQKIGLLSLGASEEDLKKIAAIYWYTLQFGVCNENNKNKAFGAGIAACVGEIQHLQSKNAKFKPFEPQIDCLTTYPVQTVQHCYRVNQSFENALKIIDDFKTSVNKPFVAHYNEQTKSIEYDRNIEAVQMEQNQLCF